MTKKISPTLHPINVEEFIQKVNAKPVLSDKTFENKKERKLHPKGVYSEEIFGFLGTQQRFEKWGYIPFPFKIFAPFVFDRVSDGIAKMFLGGDAFNAVLTGEPFYLLNDGSFSSSPEDKKRQLYSIYEFKTLDDLYKFLKEGEKNHEFQILKKYWYETKKNAKLFDKFLEYLDAIFIDKLLVIPAGYRDILITKDGKVVEDALSKEYKEIIKNLIRFGAIESEQNKRNNSTNTTNKKEEDNNDITASITDLKSIVKKDQQENEDDEEESTAQFTNQDYKTTVKYIYISLQNIIKGIADILGLGGANAKYKLIQGAKISKRVDHAVRLVLEPDKSLTLDEVGIPWMFLIKLYEPFVLHYIEKDGKYKDVKEWVLKEITSISETDEEFQELQNIRTIPKEKFLKFANTIVMNPEIVPQNIKALFIDILQRIINGEKDGVVKRVLLLRHPVEDAEHLLGLVPKIIEKNVYVTTLNPQNFARLGADCDGDQVNIYALHTPEANKHMKFLSPIHKKGELSIRQPNSLRNSIDMDISLTLY
jgi:hypothetical protein